MHYLDSMQRLVATPLPDAASDEGPEREACLIVHRPGLHSTTRTAFTFEVVDYPKKGMKVYLKMRCNADNPWKVVSKMAIPEDQRENWHWHFSRRLFYTWREGTGITSAPEAPL